jgi:tetratricopeptide (TPR) repeat protein
MGVKMINKENDFDLNIQWRFPEGRRYGFTFIALFMLLIVIYTNSFQGQWVLDDDFNILANENIHLKNLDITSLKQALFDPNGSLNRPLAYLSFGINYYFGETNIFGYHLVNFAIHYLTAIFLFLFIFKTLHLPKLRDTYATHAYSIALIATVFWAINPLQVTAVTYIVQRMASMAGLFYLMAMYSYLLGRTATTRGCQIGFFAAALLCALLSFASKENAAMLPVSIFVYDLLLIQGVSKATLKRNLIIAAVPLALLVLLFFWKLDLSGILKDYEDRPFTLMERLLTQPRILFFYISQLLYPLESHLMLNHDVPVSKGLFSPVTTLMSIMGIAGLISFAVARSAKYPLLAFSILFFFINHAIEGSFIALELVYEHRNYIPSFFFFVPIAIFIVKTLQYFSYRKFVQVGIALLMAVLWIGQGHTVYKRNALFADPVVLWFDNVLKAPGLSRVHASLGDAYYKKGSYEIAFKSFLKAEELGTFHRVFSEGINLNNLGGYYLHIGGQPDRAHFYFERAVRKYPEHWRTWYYLALSKMALGRFAETEALALKLREMWPNNDYFHYILGLSYLKQNAFERCKETALRAIKRTSQPQAFFRLLGAAYYYEHDFKVASKYWNQVLQIETKNPEVLLALVETYHRMGNYGDRNRLVEILLCLKENKTWVEYITTAAKDNSINAYIIRRPALLSIIGASLRDMAP